MLFSLGRVCLTNISLPLSQARVIFEILPTCTGETVYLPCFTVVSNVIYQISSVWHHRCVMSQLFKSCITWKALKTLQICNNNFEHYCDNCHAVIMVFIKSIHFKSIFLVWLVTLHDMGMQFRSKNITSSFLKIMKPTTIHREKVIYFLM